MFNQPILHSLWEGLPVITPPNLRGHVALKKAKNLGEITLDVLPKGAKTCLFFFFCHAQYEIWGYYTLTFTIHVDDFPLTWKYHA